MDVGWELRVVGRHLGKHLIEIVVCATSDCFGTLSRTLVLLFFGMPASRMQHM
jgi:hypothetical protein